MVTFVNTGVSEAAGLVVHIQKLVDANQSGSLRAFVVFTGGPGLKGDIEKLAAEKGITIPLVYLPGGKSDSAMAEYKVNPQVKTTVLVTRHKRVTANFVNVDGSQFEPVAEATHKMLASSS